MIISIAWSRSDRLIHDAQRIAHRAVAGLRKQRKRGILSSNILLPRNHLELREDVVKLDRMKAEVLAARTDRLRNVLRLGSCHHENDVRRRLFQRFKQSVEGS